MSNPDHKELFFFMKPNKAIIIILFMLLMLAGVGIRLIDLDDLPLDIATTRQLHSLIMSRGFYYQMDTPETQALDSYERKFGIRVGNAEPVIEPPVVEKLAALTYRMVGEENILIPRLYSIFFWVIGGIPLFLLTRKLTTLNGSFASLAIYLFNPFGAIASRSFQPDPMMVMFILWALYFQIRWVENINLKNSILAGLFTGIAFLVKAPAVFFVGFPLAGLVLSTGIKKAFTNWRVYLMAALALIPAIAYTLISATAGGNADSIFGSRWFPGLFDDPRWYLSWLLLGRTAAGTFPLLLALLGLFLIQDKKIKIFYACMWLGYAAYGYTFAYHIYTHNYYHLPLIPIIAIGFGFAFAAFFEKMQDACHTWLPKVLVISILLFGILLAAQRIRGELVGSDYRNEAAYWQQISEDIGENASVIGLVHDYGYRLIYWGNVNPQIWPSTGDLTVQELSGSTSPDFLKLFKTKTEGMDYFLVTMTGELRAQKALKEHLETNYPVIEGDGYLLYDLGHPLSQGN